MPTNIWSLMPASIADPATHFIRGMIDQAMSRITAPGGVYAGQQPQVPGQWSDLDEAKAQLNAQGQYQWGPQQALAMMTSPFAGVPSGALGMGRPSVEADIADTFFANKPGGLLGPTALTMRWRNMVRGQDRVASEAHDAAEAARTGQPLDPYQQQLIATPMGQYTLARSQAYNVPEAWERRALVGLPGAKFENGQLSNADELRPVYADILRRRIANPISDASRAHDQATLADLMTRMQPPASPAPPSPQDFLMMLRNKYGQ